MFTVPEISLFMGSLPNKNSKPEKINPKSVLVTHEHENIEKHSKVRPLFSQVLKEF